MKKQISVFSLISLATASIASAGVETPVAVKDLITRFGVTPSTFLYQGTHEGKICRVEVWVKDDTVSYPTPIGFMVSNQGTPDGAYESNLVIEANATVTEKQSVTKPIFKISNPTYRQNDVLTAQFSAGEDLKNLTAVKTEITDLKSAIASSYHFEKSCEGLKLYFSAEKEESATILALAQKAVASDKAEGLGPQYVSCASSYTPDQINCTVGQIQNPDTTETIYAAYKVVNGQVTEVAKTWSEVVPNEDAQPEPPLP